MGCASSKKTTTASCAVLDKKAPAFPSSNTLLYLENAQNLETILAEAKQQRLRKLDVFVLDNSLRETVVAAIKGQVAADKDAILASLAGTGLTEIIGECELRERSQYYV